MEKWAKLTKLDAAVRQRRLRGGHRRRGRRLPATRDCSTRSKRTSAASSPARGGDGRLRATISGKWGLVDFVDQDRLALALLGKEDVRVQLSERVQSVFVDEFQDTSPLQLAVFIELSQIAESSVWVGDPKQSIYGFRGTDPELIARVAQDVRTATGGEDATLRKNYRSRPAWTPSSTTPSDGRSRGRDCRRAARIDEVDRNDLPGQSTPLAVWRLSGRKTPSV